MLLNWPNPLMTVNQGLFCPFGPKLRNDRPFITPSPPSAWHHHFLISTNSPVQTSPRKRKIEEQQQQKEMPQTMDKVKLLPEANEAKKNCPLKETGGNLANADEGILQPQIDCKNEPFVGPSTISSPPMGEGGSISISTASSTASNSGPTPSAAGDSKIGNIECAICGAPASGVHYYVWSCNGCKTFFRRSIMENRKYSCKRQGKCQIGIRSRCICRHCRFAKCQKVGMKFTEINVDRKRPIPKEDSVEFEDWKNSEMTGTPKMKELMEKEHKFRILLNCQKDFGTKYANLNEAMAGGNNGENLFEEEGIDWEEMKLEKINKSEGRLTFYHWRAKMLSHIIDWARSFSSFKQMLRPDQDALIVHSSFALLAFCEAFHTLRQYGDRLVFPDGLQVTRNFSNGIYFEANGLHRAMVPVINEILAPIRRIQMTEMEYALIQALILFDPDCLALSEAAMEIVEAEREMLLRNLRQYLDNHCKGRKLGSANRMAQLLLRIPQIQKVAEFKRQFFTENAEIPISSFCMQQSSLAIDLASKYQNTSFF